MERPLDVIVYGATGFTGRQAAAYLHAHAPEGLRWGIAGRNAGKLQAIAAACGDPPVIVADSQDPASVSAMVAQARVVLSTAGPFCKYGDPVVDACVEHGAHYADITGETPWARRVIDRHHDAAKAAGTVLLPFSGFDSVPSDLGTWWFVRQLQRDGHQVRSVQAVFSTKGGFNGGTLATARTIAELYTPKEMANPFLLDPNPDTDRERWTRHKDPTRPVFQPTLERWVSPFLMGAINTRVVRRSAALFAEQQQGYGSEFAYQEYMVGGRNKATAWSMALALDGFGAMVQRPMGRQVVKRLGPKPGEGPSEAAMDGGFVKVRYIAETDQGVHRAELKADGDPGNRVTVRILCETGFALAEHGVHPGQGGVLTPAFALGETLQARLEATGAWSLARL